MEHTAPWRPLHCSKKLSKIDDIKAPNEDLTQDSVVSNPAKCDAAGCIGDNQFAHWSSCHTNKCLKFIHKECHDRMLDRYPIEPIADPLTSKTLFVCSKTCYNKVFKTIIQQPTSQIPWDKDGQQGPDNPDNSL